MSEAGQGIVAASQLRVPGFNPELGLLSVCRLHCVCAETISSTHVPISLRIHLNLMWQLLMVSNSLITLDCAAGLYQLTWRVLIKDSLWQKCALWSFECMQGGALNKGLLKCTIVCVCSRTHCACMCTHSRPHSCYIFVRILNPGLFWTFVGVFSFKIYTPWFYDQKALQVNATSYSVS